jgi:hypothetical protein
MTQVLSQVDHQAGFKALVMAHAVMQFCLCDVQLSILFAPVLMGCLSIILSFGFYLSIPVHKIMELLI